MIFKLRSTFFLVSEKLSFRLKKETSNNVVDTTFKQPWEICKITSNFVKKEDMTKCNYTVVLVGYISIISLRGFIGFCKSQQMNDWSVVLNYQTGWEAKVYK